MLRLSQTRIGRDESLGIFAGFPDDGTIATQIGHAKWRQAVLPVLSRASDDRRIRPEENN